MHSMLSKIAIKTPDGCYSNMQAGQLICTLNHWNGFYVNVNSCSRLYC